MLIKLWSLKQAMIMMTRPTTACAYQMRQKVNSPICTITQSGFIYGSI